MQNINKQIITFNKQHVLYTQYVIIKERKCKIYTEYSCPHINSHTTLTSFLKTENN